jgi:hypothetical protein
LCLIVVLKISENFFSEKNPFDVETTELSPLTRMKRQGSVDPKAYLDQEIEYLITTLPEMIDVAIEKTEASQRFKVFITACHTLSFSAELDLLIKAFGVVHKGVTDRLPTSRFFLFITP